MARPEERTEAATPRRRQEARREGLTIQAPEVSRALGVVGLLLVGLYFGAQGGGLVAVFPSSLSVKNVPQTPGVPWAMGHLEGLLLTTFSYLAVPFGIALILALVGGVAVGGLRGVPIGKRLSQLNPFMGFQRMFSRRSLFEGGLSLVKLAAFTGVGAFIWYGTVRTLLGGILPLAQVAGVAGRGAIAMGGALAGVALIVAAGDYFFGRRQFEQNVKMTRQELKEEMRRTEGDPLVRLRIRSLMRRRAQSHMMARVKEADVVITNPTHYAVALGYDPRRMKAPQVLAKGMGFIAARIREEARTHGVPIVPSPPLAQALHRSVEIGRPIPPELFAAVAEVLAYVYRQKGVYPTGTRPRGGDGR